MGSMPLDQPEATVFFDEGGYVLVDGGRLPITQMFDRKGHRTDDPDRVAVVIAGEGDQWVSLRILRPIAG